MCPACGVCAASGRGEEGIALSSCHLHPSCQHCLVCLVCLACNCHLPRHISLHCKYYRQNDSGSIEQLRVAIRSNECPEEFPACGLPSGTQEARSRGNTDGSGGDRPSSSRFSSGSFADPHLRDGQAHSHNHNPLSALPASNINSNTFQWIQHSHTLANQASSTQPLNQHQLRKAWNVSEFLSVADWNNWFKRFLIELIRESPSPYLRACAGLAQAHFPFAQELFQAAFVSCWKELSKTNKDSLIAALLVALQADKFPSDILLVFLNLAEFMEHDVNALPIEPRVLAGLAEKSLAYAKALHYRELEFLTSPATCFESLININKKLNIYDGAMGVLQKMNAHKEQARLREDMLMSLEKWPEALEVYEKKLEVAPFNKGALMNKIKCLTSMGRWEEALEILTQRADLLGVPGKKVGKRKKKRRRRRKRRKACAWSLVLINLNFDNVHVCDICV